MKEASISRCLLMTFSVFLLMTNDKSEKKNTIGKVMKIKMISLIDS